MIVIKVYTERDNFDENEKKDACMHGTVPPPTTDGLTDNGSPAGQPDSRYSGSISI
jgi:hypothetical protein